MIIFDKFTCFKHMTMKTGIISLLLTVLNLTAAAQSFSVMRHYDISDGISDNSIRSVIQDRTGYIWLGTKDGISRFDGRSFTSFGGYPRTSDGYLLNVFRLYPHSDGKNIWVGAVDGLYLFDCHSEEFTHLSNRTESGRMINSLVNDLCYDDRGRLWIASVYGLFCYDEATDSLKVYVNSGQKGDIPHNVITCLLKDSSGRIWVGTRKGLSFYNEVQDQFMTYVWKSKNPGNVSYEVSHLIETVNGEIWAGSQNDGLMRFDPLNGRFTSFRVSDGTRGNTWIRSIHEMNERYLLLGSENGLFTFDRKTEKAEHVRNFNQKAVYSFITDHEGGIWVGTYFDGIFYISPQNGNLGLYQERQGNDSMKGKAISQFCEDEYGNIWIATEDEGLNHFNPETGVFTHYSASTRPPHQISHNNIHALMLDGDRLWIGTFSKGIDIMDTKSRVITRNFSRKGNDPYSLPNNHIYSIYKTRSGDVYIGTLKGLCRWIRGTDRFESYKQLSNVFVYDIIEDHTGRLWLGTKNHGVICFHNEKFTSYRHSPSDSTSIGNNHVLRIHIDKDENLWFATEGNGISRYDYNSDSFVNYNHTKGLYHHIIYGILDDAEGNLWLSSNHGIVKYNPQTHESAVYTHEDGLQSNQFNYRSSMKASDGRFYFGGINGFNSFYPSGFHVNRTKPNVAISGIAMYNRYSSCERVKPNENRRIVIKPYTTSFEISFDCLSFIAPSKNRFAYMVDRLHDDWIYTDKPSVTLMDLSTGKYRFMVKAANNDGEWSDTSYIDIVVKAPLWRSTAAIIFYILLFCVICILAVLWYIGFLRKERDREMQQMEMEMQQETYRSKFQFFTHIAHEIKTPLTLIKAPLEVILEEGKWSDSTQENLLVIRQNTDRLMELIRQLLNFRKIDNDDYKLNYTEVDVNDFIEAIILRFGKSSRNISIEAVLPKKPLSCIIDEEALTKILSNLLANGLKYASSKIVVKVEAGTDSDLLISVADDGPGISENERKKIFEPFFRSQNSNSENGFGIGLSLVKLLVEKMGGEITAGKCDILNGFLVNMRIPQGTLHTDNDRKEVSEGETLIKNKAEISRSNILVVDDTKEMLDFLAKNLSNDFNIRQAQNGLEALGILKNHAVDLIVSDIVMPEMDGFEFLHAVRSDKMLCHIPFILLSAQANVNSKITGLDYGADAYIEKPFSLNYLKATIENLLKSRKVLFERFASMPNLEYGKGELKKHDVEWLEQVNDIIKRNLTNEQFTVEMLASEMAVSRSSLRRKILGVTGLAPNDYIRLIRLKVAAELLNEGKYRVNEVCYLIGFSNQSYFARCFQKQFGVLPKDFNKG